MGGVAMNERAATDIAYVRGANADTLRVNKKALRRNGRHVPEIGGVEGDLEKQVLSVLLEKTHVVTQDRKYACFGGMQRIPL